VVVAWGLVACDPPVIGAGGPDRGPPVGEGRPSNGRDAFATRVVDGDTIEVRLGAHTRDVRLIGVDTPETVHPTDPVECFGDAASRFTEGALESKQIRLEFDVERKDQYGRTLAYVWLGPQLLNRTLVRRGYATVATFPPNVRYVDAFLAAERKARAGAAGLWGACLDEGEGEEPDDGRRCDPSYAGVCIPAPPPDLDCADVPFDRFLVVGADAHRFDGDGDGVGCDT